jgi:hypothetical protein
VGSTFVVRLPSTRAASAPAPRMAPVAADSSGSRRTGTTAVSAPAHDRVDEGTPR